MLSLRRSADAAAARATALLLVAASALAACSFGLEKDDGEEEKKKEDPPREIIFTTEGSTFSPVIELDPAISATVRWTFADGTTSASAAPTVDYGSIASRAAKLSVSPWSALTAIDIGYDGGDGGNLGRGSGTENFNYSVPDQKVSKVENLDLAAASLKIWCSSYNYIQRLDFTDFVKLETIECFLSASLFSVLLENVPSLSRACFEDCDLMQLDLTDCPNLADLRGAVNDYATIVFGDYVYEKVWHICVRDNSQLSDRTLFSDMSKFPNIREFFIWNDYQNGNLAIHSTSAGWAGILCDGNSFSSLDLSGALREESQFAEVSMRNNALRSVNIAGCDQITNFCAPNNGMDSALVDSILIALDGMGRARPENPPWNSFNIDLSANAAPGVAGQAAAARLQAKGWIVAVAAE